MTVASLFTGSDDLIFGKVMIQFKETKRNSSELLF